MACPRTPKRLKQSRYLGKPRMHKPYLLYACISVPPYRTAPYHEVCIPAYLAGWQRAAHLNRTSTGRKHAETVRTHSITGRPAPARAYTHTHTHTHTHPLASTRLCPLLHLETLLCCLSRPGHATWSFVEAWLLCCPQSCTTNTLTKRKP
ncbi:hypothetical protein LZ30DRAFT_720847 [Colletotrichum cereale]|nr:hypothetical protein LZ30DRAFT_720847 [Colletotrichum cereale]